MKLLIVLLVISISALASDDYKQNAILNTCLWKADIAQGAQIAIQEYPARTPLEHAQKINYLLQDKEEWYRQAVLDVFREVFEKQSIHKSSTKVFVDIYNECIKKTKEDLENGIEYPEIPLEVTEEYHI